jgi:hypothetical protein
MNRIKQFLFYYFELRLPTDLREYHESVIICFCDVGLGGNSIICIKSVCFYHVFRGLCQKYQPNALWRIIAISRGFHFINNDLKNLVSANS